MTTRNFAGRLAVAGLMALGGLAWSVSAQETPIMDALNAVDEDVRVFNDHLTFLAHPYLGGRLPGTQGMEITRDYVEHYFREAGLEPGFTDESGTRTYRQGFPLGGTVEVTQSYLAVMSSEGSMAMRDGDDYTVTAMGGSGTVASPLTFVGYGINNAREEYTTFDDDASLEGKVAMVLRFEPMNEDGQSLWADDGWSRSASFNSKLRNVASRNPDAIILVNTPGADDPRNSTLMSASSGGNSMSEVPVIHMSPEAASKLVEACDDEGRSLMDMRRMADEEGTVVDLEGIVTIDAALERRPLIAENVGGMIPGHGDLADEVIIIGAHADHLGMGAFGSRASASERGTKLHPGADDNASGTAGIIMIAHWLSEQIAALPEDTDRRSILIVAFDGEESGLNGSRYYVNNPIVPLEDHYFMMNFDMIGRILNKRLSVSGGNSAAGFAEWLEPFYDASGLEIVQANMSGGSDHLPFMQRQVPYLFAIIADFHGDYHTPADTSDKINRVDAVKAAKLFSDIAFAGAQRPESLVWGSGESEREAQNENRPQGSGPGGIRVRFGVMPGNYDGSGGGVLLDAVTEGGPAEKAGLQAGDRLVRWDGQKIADVEAWMGLLGRHDAGDEVNVGVVRAGEEITLQVTLEGRDG